MKLAEDQIDLALETYEKVVDDTFTKQNDELNSIMFVFTLVTIIMLPP